MALHEIKQLAAPLPKHLHLLLGFREMRRKRQIGTRRNLGSFRVKRRGRGKRRMWCEPDSASQSFCRSKVARISSLVARADCGSRTSIISANHHVLRGGRGIAASNSGNASRLAIVVVPNLAASAKPLAIEAR